MKVLFKPAKGPERPCSVPFAGCDYAVARGVCPRCGGSESDSDGFKVQGKHGLDRKHDRYEARAFCVACSAEVGRLVCVFDTIFGVEEDERVLNGRARVY